ncbi:MAG: FAD-dependent oxidoreductase [Syntrophorhabdales bacterium]|jgi:ribulose 1,5-bisphosphate synthetase/thiazole synthase
MQKNHRKRMMVLVIAVLLALIPVYASAAAFDTQTDVVVVGAGGAGLVASLTLAQGGVKVVLLEKNPFPGVHPMWPKAS